MSEHLIVPVDRLVKPEKAAIVQIVQDEAVSSSYSLSGEKKLPLPRIENAGASSSSRTRAEEKVEVEEEENGVSDEESSLLKKAECRICQEEDSLKNLENPCACNGSLKYAHRKCVQHWCNEKGDITCEICHQPYQPGYTAPPRSQPEETTIDIGGGWQISGATLDLHDPRLLAFAEVERQFLEAEYDDSNATNTTGSSFCRSAALILMAFLLLRHAITVTDGGDGDEDAYTFFTLFLLRAAGFLWPCYIMAWAISILQRRRQRQEAAALAAAQLAFILQSGQSRGVQFTMASATPTATPLQEHV